MDKKRPNSPERHGESGKGRKTPEYLCWWSMKGRCFNPKNASFHRYGGRGITVCERWASSYLAFLEDMGRRPSPEHSIDRIDNDGNYEPGNCRWATKSEQGGNTSTNRILAMGGQKHLLCEWGKITGINEATIASRIDDYGWSVEKALTVPAGTANPSVGVGRKKHCANGHEYTPENSGKNSAGWRFCRICNRQRAREYMRAKRARKKKEK